MLGWSSAGPPTAHTGCCLRLRAPANTEFRKGRGIEAEVLPTNDERKAHEDFPHIYIDFSMQEKTLH